MKRTSKEIMRLPMEKRAELAFREAVAEVIAEHARLGSRFTLDATAKS
jgi:aspartate oxidase